MRLYNTPGLSQIYFRRSPSPPYLKKSSYESTGFFFVYCTHRGDEKPRPGVDNWRQPVGQTVNAVSGLPAGRAKRVNPPPTSVRARGNREHQLSDYSVNNQNAQESTEHICIIWSLPITSSLIKMPPTEIHVTCHHKIVMPEKSTIEKIVN